MNHIWMLATAETVENNTEGTEVGMVEEASQDVQEVVLDENGKPVTPPDKNVKEVSPLLRFAPFILIIVVMYMLMFRGPKKKQQEHQKMVSALAKNDRVRTIGGIFGTVLDVRDDEVILKIDESTNAKIRVSPSAIATVLKDGNAE